MKITVSRTKKIYPATKQSTEEIKELASAILDSVRKSGGSNWWSKGRTITISIETEI